jgi:hypothetical protein
VVEEVVDLGADERNEPGCNPRIVRAERIAPPHWVGLGDYLASGAR